MPGLNIVILSEDAERLRGALMLALAHMALGGEARLFLQLDAVRLLAPPISAPRDADHAAHGLPSLATAGLPSRGLTPQRLIHTLPRAGRCRSCNPWGRRIG